MQRAVPPVPRPVLAALVAPVLTVVVALALAVSACLVTVGFGGTATAAQPAAMPAGQVQRAAIDCTHAAEDLADAKAAVRSDKRLVRKFTKRVRTTHGAKQRRWKRKLRAARRSLRLQLEWRAIAQKTYDDCLAGTPSPTSPPPTTTQPTTEPTSTTTTEPTSTTTPPPPTSTTSTPPLCLPLLCP